MSGAEEPDAGTVIVIMQPWAKRPPDESVDAVIARLQPEFNALPAAEIVSFPPPAITGTLRGLSRADWRPTIRTTT